MWTLLDWYILNCANDNTLYINAMEHKHKALRDREVTNSVGMQTLRRIHVDQFTVLSIPNHNRLYDSWIIWLWHFECDNGFWWAWLIEIESHFGQQKYIAVYAFNKIIFMENKLI